MATYKGTDAFGSCYGSASNLNDGAIGDTSTDAYAPSGACTFFVCGCNDTNIRSKITGGKRISKFILHYKGCKYGSSTNSTHTARFVYNATSASKYTDCGDAIITFPQITSEKNNYSEYTVDIISLAPKAVSYLNNNRSSIDNFGVRLYFNYVRISDVWWEIEFSNNITLTDSYGSYNKTFSVLDGSKLSSVPVPTRTGYNFLGWYSSQPVCDTKIYNKSANDAVVLDNKDKSHYKYTDKLSCHFEGYIEDWNDFKNMQFLSSTAGGGWAVGTYASANSGKIAGIEMGFNQNSSGTAANKYSYVSLGIESTVLNDLNNETRWHSFDIVFNNGTLKGYKDNSEQTTTYNTSYIKSNIYYNSNNRIIVGGEAGDGSSSGYTTSNKSDFLQDGYYLKGAMSTVFISNTGEKLEKLTTNTVINSDCTYYACWKVNTDFNITTSHGTGGTITDSCTARLFGKKDIVISADTSNGYYISSITVDGNAISIGSRETSYTYSFTNVSSDHTISATFSNSYNISVSKTNCTGSSNSTATYGSSTTLTFTSNQYYNLLDSLTVKNSSGTTLIQGTGYTVTANTFSESTRKRTVSVKILSQSSDITVSISFKKSTHNVYFKSDNNTLKTVQLQYGDTSSYTGTTPTKTETAQYTYTFSGWDKSFGQIFEDTTYNAVYTSTLRYYDIVLILYDGVQETANLPYGYAYPFSYIDSEREGYNLIGVKDSSDNTYTTDDSYTIVGPETFTAIWEIKKFSVSSLVKGSGTITSNKIITEYGSDWTFSINPHKSRIYKVEVNGSDITSLLQNNLYTLKNVRDNVTILAVFQEYEITDVYFEYLGKRLSELDSNIEITPGISLFIKAKATGIE